MTEAEYREHVRAALIDGLMSFEGAAVNEETKQAMMEKVIEVWPPRPPIKWVESVKIENGLVQVELTEEARELLSSRGWGEADAQHEAG
jgi:hypothetical protein